MRNIAFLIVIAVFLSGCSVFLNNPTSFTAVDVSITTAEPPNRDVYFRTYRDLPQFANGPEIQEAVAIVDIVLHRRGYELQKSRVRDAIPLDNRYRHPDSGDGQTACAFLYYQGKGDKTGNLSICLSRSEWYIGPGQEVMEARDEIFAELVKRFGTNGVTRRMHYDHAHNPLNIDPPSRSDGTKSRDE